MVVITNNVPRPVLRVWDLTGEELAEVEYPTEIDSPVWAKDVPDEWVEREWFRYRGVLYDLRDFCVWGTAWTGPRPDHLKGWDAFVSDSFFSGIAIRYPSDGCGGVDYESVVVALCLS